MLPAPKTSRPRLGDVLQSCLSAVRDEPNTLGLPRVSKAIVVLVDGLGAAALKARAGHARTLAQRLDASSVIESGFPTTTAAALASLTTGVQPGQHGLVGYSVLDAANDRVVNQLSGWDDRLDPATWQRFPTLFEQATASGLDAVAIGPARYSDSGLTRAILRGARYLPAATIEERFDLAGEWLRQSGSGIGYVYVPELDSAGHAEGWQSSEWTERLEQLDSAVRLLSHQIGPRAGVLVTADHGMLDVPPSSHVLFDLDPELVDGVRFVAGEPRCLQLHFDTSADAVALESAWRESESERSWIATRAEAIAAGWFGDVAPEVAPRIGDLLIAARKNVAYYDSRSASDHSREMIGQHGSWSAAETTVPLVRFGAFEPR
jgi:hypothetical protein